MATVGDRIREIRDKRGMTQEQLSKASDISKGFLSDVENNKRNISAQGLLRIANNLGASVDFLLMGVSSECSQDREIVIPHSLSLAAEKLHLSYSQTLELLEAHKSVLARRSDRVKREFTIEDWEHLHNAIKKVFG